MIEVERLTKWYGSVRAVDRVSFRAGRGEVVGLLGPNGAGKTTTMRMLTTYLTPTSGRAVLAGHDVLDDPVGVRRSLGYLPENVPLYGEMRVKEFLWFRGRLKDVPRGSRRLAVSRAISRCRLSEVEDRVIGQLSRGYRQRVGLADALLHDPPILILDEPTSGLDPIQIRESRDLIRDLGDRHTVLLSTHILSEVEAVCRRVIIIAGGRIALDEQVDRLKAGGTVVVEARGPADAIRTALASISGVRRVTSTLLSHGLAGFEVEARDGQDLREAVAQRLSSHGWTLRALELRRGSLEERFVDAVTRDHLARSGAELAHA